MRYLLSSFTCLLDCKDQCCVALPWVLMCSSVLIDETNMQICISIMWGDVEGVRGSLSQTIYLHLCLFLCICVFVSSWCGEGERGLERDPGLVVLREACHDMGRGRICIKYVSHWFIFKLGRSNTKISSQILSLDSIKACHHHTVLVGPNMYQSDNRIQRLHPAQ